MLCLCPKPKCKAVANKPNLNCSSPVPSEGPAQPEGGHMVVRSVSPLLLTPEPSCSQRDVKKGSIMVNKSPKPKVSRDSSPSGSVSPTGDDPIEIPIDSPEVTEIRTSPLMVGDSLIIIIIVISIYLFIFYFYINPRRFRVS